MSSSTREFLARAEQNNPTPADHLRVHVAFFLQLADNWRAYINFLEAQLFDMVQLSLINLIETCLLTQFS